MNYYLIANNESITDKTIENLHIKEEDVIILYNKQLPLKWDKVRKHKNKYLFLRKNKKWFWGKEKIKDCDDTYKKIIFIKDDDNYSEIEKICEKNNINKELVEIYCGLEHKNYVNLGNKSPQSGLMSYIYIKENYIYDRIYLIGFTNEYKTSLWKGHSKEIEQEFYKKEIELNKNIIKIDF